MRRRKFKTRVGIRRKKVGKKAMRLTKWGRVRQPQALFPDTVSTKLIFDNDYNFVTAADGSVDLLKTFSGCSPAAPDLGVVTEQASRGWYFWNNIYRHSECYGSKITIKFLTMVGDPGASVDVYLSWNDISTPLPNDPRDARNFTSVMHKNIMGGTQRLKAATLSKFMLARKIQGNRRYAMDKLTWNGPVPPEDFDDFNYMISSNQVGVGGPGIPMNFRVRITYYTKFFGRRDNGAKWDEVLVGAGNEGAEGKTVPMPAPCPEPKGPP